MHDNTSPVIPKNFNTGDFLVTEDNPNCISSAIKILSTDDKGYKCKRIHFIYKGEEFFMSRDAMSKTKWVLVKNNVQLPLL